MISSSSKGQKANKSISLDSSTTKLTVRVYSEEPDKDNPKYSDKENKLYDYTIKVKYTGNNNDNNDNDDDNDSSDYDDIYLDDLTLTYSGDDIDFDFDKETTSYDIKVKKDVSYVKLWLNQKIMIIKLELMIAQYMKMMIMKRK